MIEVFFVPLPLSLNTVVQTLGFGVGAGVLDELDEVLLVFVLVVDEPVIPSACRMPPQRPSTRKIPIAHAHQGSFLFGGPAGGGGGCMGGCW